jgi:dihydrolipoamide dehydrogenase
MDKGIEEPAECTRPHPSITEGIQECVRMLMGKLLFKPTALRGKLSCRKWEGAYHELDDDEFFQCLTATIQKDLISMEKCSIPLL